MTKEEKEALFAEFEERIASKKKKQGYASGYETMNNLKPACDYFWARYHNITDSYVFDIWSPYGIPSGDWDMIRKLVCHAYGVSIVKDIPSEKLDDANKLAKQIIDMLFAVNINDLNEKTERET